MEIHQVKKITNETLEAFQRLIPQLDKTVPALIKERLVKTISSPNTLLFAVWDKDKIHGTATLILYTSATGNYAHLEDIVVDEKMRGKGIGTKLILIALKTAKEKGARIVNLTSRPSRKAANRLYKKIGFVKRKTNVYRFIL